jgi:hypothetical protein
MRISALDPLYLNTGAAWHLRSSQKVKCGPGRPRRLIAYPRLGPWTGFAGLRTATVTHTAYFVGWAKRWLMSPLPAKKSAAICTLRGLAHSEH